MKVKDLIKYLQEADPTGECHVRVDGGAILGCEPKEGYWDGPYQYIDWDRNKYVISTKGDKVDIRTMDAEDWIWDHDGDTSGIELQLTYCDDTREKEYRKHFEEVAEEAKIQIAKMNKEFLKKVNDFASEGWAFREDKKNGSWSKSMMERIKNKKVEKMCVGECNAITKSGAFEIQKEDKRYIYWRLK
jgi:hypothetical protein